MSDVNLRPSRRGHRAPGGRTARGCLAVLVAVAVVLALVGVVVWRGIDVVSGWFDGPEDFQGQGSGSVRVEIVPGDSSADIGASLREAGVVASVEAFTLAASGDPRSVGIQPGFYQLQEQMSAKAALAALVGGEAMIDNTVTIPEGFTVEETLQRIAEETDLTLAQLDQAARDTEALDLPSYADGDVEGYLYPSTYPIEPNATATEVLAAMVIRFRQEAARLSLEQRATEADLGAGDVVIVASLIEAEVSRAGDLAKVARVIYNRLDDGMRLELDSTVSFASGSSGSIYTTDKERRNPSRYNTYRYAGLPPTAIDAPGERALEAALEPARGDWTYFVTVNLETGRTLFADNFSDHLDNDAKLDAWCTESDLC